MFTSPFFISLRIALCATILVFISGLFFSYYSLQWKKARKIMDIVFMLPMVMPPTVIGFFLLVVLSRQYAFGQFLISNHINIIFTWWAGVLSSYFVAFPLMYRSAQSAMEQLDPSLCNAARTLGMKEWNIFWKVIFPNCLPGILSGTILAFTRAFGEFGATIMVTGNIPNKTQTISMAIYSAMQSGNITLAIQWVSLMIVFSSICIFIMNYCVQRSWKKGKK